MLSPQDKWCSETLDEVFTALSLSPELTERLVYKGARVLRLLLGEPLRASLDIDASLANISANMAVGPTELEHLRALAEKAIVNHFEDQSPVRYSLQRSTIYNRRRSGPHPRDWNVYWIDLAIRDLADPNFSLAAPALRVDIAAPELTSERSVRPILFNGRLVNAVTLERMAGEKLRAFLSSLPQYRNKLGERIHPPRAKDLYDLARILRKRPLRDDSFWLAVGDEFTLACQSRCIDCQGIETFKEAWSTTEETYRKDPTVPDDVPFQEAQQTLEKIVEFYAHKGLFPMTHELPMLP